jgi:uncharacterized protein YbjT (DUF2867 family)
MKILITTPSSRIGRRVLNELLAPEFSVRIIARHLARLPENILEQVEVVQGSTDEAATLRRALDGVEALFWRVPSAPFQEENVQGHHERFTRAACEAVRVMGIPRVVAISATVTRFAPNAAPDSGPRAMEAILNESGAAIRHLRCVPSVENLLSPIPENSGRFSSFVPKRFPIRMAAASDISDVALRWLARRDWEGIRAIEVPGPEDRCQGQAQMMSAASA